MLQPCPGCPSRYPEFDGATHPYIGASAACWAVYSAVLAGAAPDDDLIRLSTAEASHGAGVPKVTGTSPLLVDAYAAQHHGEPSPQAVQSVAVHLLVLHGVFDRGVAVADAIWIRRRALRRKGVFEWLTPPPRDAALSLRHCIVQETVSPVMSETYVASVHAAWTALHGGRIGDWYERFVVGD